MGLYQLKEFLTLDDVADYLRDKGVYDFDLSVSRDCERLKEWLLGQVRNAKITTVYSIDGDFLADVYNNMIIGGKIVPFCNIHKIEIGKIKGYFKHISDDKYQLIQYHNNHTLSNRNFFKTCKSIRMDVKEIELLAKTGRANDDYYMEFIPNVKIHNMPKIDEYYPKSDLDALFNAKDDSQQQIADLQADNARLQARITELESELNQQANATPAIKHTNTALQALHDVLVTHWQDYDPSQPRTRPKQEFITAWILENYPEIEPSKALWIDKIIRHGTHN